MTDHTPGPWIAEYESIWTEPLGEDSIYVAETFNRGYTKADARLIAAAPDLLAACEAALDYLPNQPEYKEELSLALQLHDAIAKARAKHD